MKHRLRKIRLVQQIASPDNLRRSPLKLALGAIVAEWLCNLCE